MCERLLLGTGCSRRTSFRHKRKAALGALVLGVWASPGLVLAFVDVPPEVGPGHFAATVGARRPGGVALVLVPDPAVPKKPPMAHARIL